MLLLFVLFFVQTGINAQAPANYMSCAKEGERCIFEGTKEVMYGAKGGFAKKTATNFIDCGVREFGSDPAPGVLKQCYIPYQNSPVGNSKFTPCGKEGERCQFTGTREVMYGAGNQWATRGAANGIDCSVKVFGDPAPNVHKQCYVSTVSSGPGTRTFPETYGGGPLTLKPVSGTNYLKISTGGQGFFDIPQSTIVASPVKALKKGNKVVEYTLNNIPDKYLGYGTAIANMKFKPKAALKDGILYVFLTTGESSINVTKGTLKDGNGKAYNIFEDKPTARGYFLDGLKVVITADDNFEKRKSDLLAKGAELSLQFDLFLFPDNQNPGCFENLIIEIINPKYKEFIDCFDGYSQCISACKAPAFEIPIKSKLFAFLECTGQEQQIKKINFLDSEYWDLEHSKLKPLKEFILRQDT